MYVNSSVAIFCLLALSLAPLTSGLTGDEDAWREFKEKYGKQYATEQEERYRMSVFLDNKHYIETKSQDNSFSQGLNSLSDLTTEEINKSRNGFRLDEDADNEPDDRLLASVLAILNSHEKAWSPFQGYFPATLDWRYTGRVSRVKDQGSCGSCWAFATTGALESALVVTRNRSVLLSEQNLVDCSRSYGNHGCSGGLMDAAFRYVRDHGIMASRDYPYTAKDETCKFRRGAAVTRCRGSITLPRGNEALLRLVLALNGPLPVAIDASSRSFHLYKSGVYDDKTCKNSGRSLNHALLLVGYGTDPKGGDYWIVKNSWGRSWGDNGYIKMARNRGNRCGIASYAVLPLL